MEVWESLTDMTFRTKALVTDSGGPGESRGGLGQEVILVNDTGHEMAISCFAMRTEYPARGMMGGHPGALRSLRINGETVDPGGRHILKPGDVVTVVDSGGGGFGDPLNRDAGKVLRDVLDGAVSIEAALRDYGVEVDALKKTAERASSRA